MKEIEEKVKDTLDKLEQVRQMGPRVRLRTGEIVRELFVNGVKAGLGVALMSVDGELDRERILKNGDVYLIKQMYEK